MAEFDDCELELPDVEDLARPEPGKNDVVTVEPRKKSCRSLLQQLRPRYFYVSDFVTQNWCAQKAVLAIKNPGWEETMEEVRIMIDKSAKPVIKLGTKIHKAREEEVHVKVPVVVKTAEDSFGIRLLNTYSQLSAVMHGNLVREVPVFGMPLDLGIVIFGVIDEIRLDPADYTVTLREMKTRNCLRSPSSAQKSGHDLQLMLYKILLEDLTRNRLSWSLTADILRLDSKKVLSGSVVLELKKIGSSASTLDELFTEMTQCLAAFPKDIKLCVEYVSQKTKKCFSNVEIEFDRVWISQRMNEYLNVWTGKKSLEGPNENEAWKCQSCYFADLCEWRQKKAKSFCGKQ